MGRTLPCILVAKGVSDILSRVGQTPHDMALGALYPRVTWIPPMLRKRHLIPLSKSKVQKVEAYHPCLSCPQIDDPQNLKDQNLEYGEKCQSSWVEREKGQALYSYRNSLARVPSIRLGEAS